jgi:hypothetical protein
MQSRLIQILSLSWYQIPSDPKLLLHLRSLLSAPCDNSMASSPAHSSNSSGSSNFASFPAAQSATTAVVQTVNIRVHVPVLLDMDKANYSQWRCFFDSVLGKFRLEAHVTAPPPMA